MVTVHGSGGPPLDGAEVVSVWGGVAAREPERPWTHDTLAVIFSGTKGLVAACALILVDRGHLDLDAPVAHYWPEFGAAGKSHVTVGEILSHQGRLPGVRAPLQVMDLHDPTRLENLLGAQP